jgi:nuclear receptor subfamily 1 group D protein 3
VSAIQCCPLLQPHTHSFAITDRTGLSDKKTVERIQDRLIEALKLQISRNHALEPNLFASILMKIPELRTLGAKHTDQLSWFRKNWHCLHLPPLFAEIYDVPKLETDPEAMQAQQVQQQQPSAASSTSLQPQHQASLSQLPS